MNIKTLIRDYGNHSVEEYIVDTSNHYIDPAWFDKDDCKECYGNPCVCEEEKTWIPVQQYYFWSDKENIMIPCGTFPEHPRAKRMWDQSVPLN